MTGKLDEGQVAITLGGETRYLIPTPDAIRAICREYGGIQTAINGIGMADFNVYEFILAAGLQITDKDEREKLGEELFAEGYLDLATPLRAYIMTLANGGKPPADAETANGEASEPPGEANGVQDSQNMSTTSGNSQPAG